MEFQNRGVVHFHLFFEREYFEQHDYLLPRYLERKHRHGKPVDVIRGPLDIAFSSAWLDSIEKTPEAIAFNRGGILELLRTPDAAARYVAKEAGKRAQKALPEGVETCGTWWWTSKAARPVLVNLETIQVDQVAHLPFKHVWDGSIVPRGTIDIGGALLHV